MTQLRDIHINTGILHDWITCFNRVYMKYKTIEQRLFWDPIPANWSYQMAGTDNEKVAIADADDTLPSGGDCYRSEGLDICEQDTKDFASNRRYFSDKKRVSLSRADKFRNVIKRKSASERRNMAEASDKPDVIKNGKPDVDNTSGSSRVPASSRMDYASPHPGADGSYSSAFFGFMGNVYETVKTSIAPKAIDFMTTQVAPRALHVMRRVLQDVPGGGLYMDSDSEGEWHDCKFEDSDSDAEHFQDADEQLQPRDRIHNICHELMTTEEAYVNRLSILVTVKQRTTKLLGEEAAKSMFKDIEVIHKFHQDYLLPQLQQRLQYWEKHKRIGDIMHKLTPFLKLYTEYVKNFQAATALVETSEDKSSSFSKLLKEIREEKKYGRLRIQAHMLEPVQRVPRYELLLSDYLKRLPGDSEDRDDTEKALEQVSEAAKHFEEMMKRDSRILELVQLQSSLDGSINIVSSSRELLKKGKIMTISAKSSKSAERRAFLFNDLFLIADSGSSRLSVKFKVKHVIELPNAQVADGNNIDIPNTFYVKTKDTVVEICLGSEEEKDEWQNAIQKQLGACTKQKLMRHGSKLLSGQQRPKPMLGKRAPVLVHQSGVTMCMVCGTAFGALKKKKHCRACGNVVCTKCSSQRYTLQYDTNKTQRVCDECFVILEDKLTTTTSSPKITRKPRAESNCLEKGYLYLSSDEGKTWKKRWFAIHENFTVYSFKAHQDIHPMTSMSLYGYTISLDDTTKRGTSIKLQGLGKAYYLSDDDSAVITRWYETLAKLVETIATSANKRDSSESDTTSLDSLQMAILKSCDSTDETKWRESIDSESGIDVSNSLSKNS